jgi:hypothetical protein
LVWDLGICIFVNSTLWFWYIVEVKSHLSRLIAWYLTCKSFSQFWSSFCLLFHKWEFITHNPLYSAF